MEPFFEAAHVRPKTLNAFACMIDCDLHADSLCNHVATEAAYEPENVWALRPSCCR